MTSPPYKVGFVSLIGDRPIRATITSLAVIVAVVAATVVVSTPQADASAWHLQQQGPADKPVATSLDPHVVLPGALPAQVAAVREGLDRFRHAGLTLPSLELRFHHTDSPCHGHKGYFDPAAIPWQIDICSELAFVITHELAHAWIEAHLDEADRDAVMEATGTPSWNGRHVGWNERGAEQAAFALQQVLRIEGHRELEGAWGERAAVFELMTGRPVPWAAD